MMQKTIRTALSHWKLEGAEILPVYYLNLERIAENSWLIDNQYYLKVFSEYSVLKKNIVFFQLESTPEILLTTQGKTYHCIKGRWFMITKKNTGEPIQSRKLLGGEDLMPFSLGKAIGKLNQDLAAITIDMPQQNLLETLSAWALPESSQILGLSKEWQIKFLAKFNSLYPRLPKQIIHRDLNCGNLLQEGGNITFLDFDLAEVNVRIFDPCYTATSILAENFFCDEFNGKNWLNLYHDLLEGFHAQVQLTEVEKEAVPYVVLAIQMICVAWFSKQDDLKELSIANQEMTKWLIEQPLLFKVF